MKKVLNDIIYCEVNELRNKSVESAMTVNGQKLIGMNPEDAIKILDQNGLIKGEDVIIPKGFILTQVNKYGGASEYNFNNGFILIDLAFDSERFFFG